MTHEQVKQVVDFVMSKMFSVSSMTKDQIATAFLEAHPEATAPPIPDTAPVHTVTAPPTMRERAVAIITEASNKDWQTEEQAKDLTIDAMLQFASEVSAKKDRRISELGKKLKDQNSMIADLWETIDESNQRISELEAQILALKQNSKARIAELEAEVKRLTHTPVVVWGEPMKCESCGRSATIIHRTDEGVLCNKCFQTNRQ